MLRIDLRVRFIISEGFFDKFLEIEVPILAQAIKLGCQLDDLQVCDAHLCENLLHTLQRYFARVVILFTQQPEGIFHVDLAKLRIRLQREY